MQQQQQLEAPRRKRRMGGDAGAATRCLRLFWLAALCSPLVAAAGFSAEVKALVEVAISRVQKFPELSLKIHGLEFIPEEPPAARLAALDEALGRFQGVLAKLRARQVANDVENLRGLLRLLAADLGCALPPAAASPADPAQLQARLADSAFTVVSVTFDRLRGLLRFIRDRVEEIRGC